jgi:transcriptional regulator with PAS, ATPase and Fis domain
MSSSLLKKLSERGLKFFLRDIEAMTLALGLAENEGNLSKLARDLQVPITTLVGRCKVLKEKISEFQGMMGA